VLFVTIRRVLQDEGRHSQSASICIFVDILKKNGRQKNDENKKNLLILAAKKNLSFSSKNSENNGANLQLDMACLLIKKKTQPWHNY
jgi:hypothetical protein